MIVIRVMMMRKLGGIIKSLLVNLLVINLKISRKEEGKSRLSPNVMSLTKVRKVISTNRLKVHFKVRVIATYKLAISFWFLRQMKVRFQIKNNFRKRK